MNSIERINIILPVDSMFSTTTDLRKVLKYLKNEERSRENSTGWRIMAKNILRKGVKS